MNIVYLFPTELPIAQSHGVQAVNMAHAWARQGVKVDLVVQKLRDSPQAVLAHYNLPPHPNLSIRQFAKKGSSLNRWHGRSFRWALRAFAARRAFQKDAYFYFRGANSTLEAIMAIAPVARLLRIPLVYEVHGIQYLDLRQTHGGRYGEGEKLDVHIARRKQLETRAYQSLTGMICISTRLRELMAGQFIMTIPSIIAPSGVHPATESPPPLASREFDIAYVGGLYDFNGIDLLLEALAKLPGARAIIVGGGQGDEQSALQSQAGRLGIASRVTFTGHVPHSEALGWMRRARILVAPLKPSGKIDRVSWCSPGKIVEYMAAAGAIVASGLPNLEDLLRNEKNALLFTPNDLSSLAETLNRLLNDGIFAQSLATQAHADHDQYTFDSRAKKISDFLHTL